MRTDRLVVLLLVVLLALGAVVLSGCPQKQTELYYEENADDIAVDIPEAEEATDEEATDEEAAEGEEPDEESSETAEGEWVTTDSGLKYQDVEVGDGKEAKAGDTVFVLYTGKLADGTVFDASVKHGNTPLDFPLGAGMVIDGWDEGIAGMKVGGKRNLEIPGDLAYGANPPPGSGIPANATLHFECELVDVK